MKVEINNISPNMVQNHTKVLICILLLFGLTFSIFHYTDEIRAPWFGVLSYSDQWETGSTIIFATNWYHEGPVNLKFAMLEYPPSIEYQTISSRSPYTSYPPGAVIPIYLISKLEGHEPNASTVMGYNLLNQFFVAFFLGLTVLFFFYKQMKVDILNSFLFSTIPILLISLLPGPLYWFQNVYFSDQAVILPFVLYIFLELLRDGMVGKNLKILDIIQNLVLFFGFLTDWLFVFIALTVYFKRVIDGEIEFSTHISFDNLYRFIKQSLRYWFVPIIAVALYVIQVVILGNIGRTLSRFLYQSGTSQNGALQLNNGLNTFFGYIFKYYGDIGFYLLVASVVIYVSVIVYFAVKNLQKQKIDDFIRVKKILYLISMFLIPCILQVMVFRTHSLENDFSVLKFSLIISIIPLVLLPLLLFILTQNFQFGRFKFKFNYLHRFFNRFKINPRLLLIFFIVFSTTLCYISVEYPDPSNLFPEPYHTYEILGNSVAKNTGYNDVVFSPDYMIRANPPQQLSYSKKIVHQVNTTNDISNILKGVKGNYQVVIMFLEPPSDYWMKILKNSSYVTDGSIIYYKINPNNFTS